jgi:hypothetical protein
MDESLLDFTPYKSDKKIEPDDFSTNLKLFKACGGLFTRCNTKWFDTSWLGLFVYIATLCSQYLLGYYAIFRGFGWNIPKHKPVRIFGDLVTVGWFAIGMISLPWHEWEKYTCIKTRDRKGFGRYMAWTLGTFITFIIYGYMGEDPLFQTSLASDLTAGQQAVYIVTFAVIALIIVYWFGKLCPCKPFKKWCAPETDRKIIFVRILFLLTLLFVISYWLCSEDDDCTYHLHHWWFGFVLVMLSTTTLDNWFDYFLQGVFWTFLIESLFNYGLVFGQFFI